MDRWQVDDVEAHGSDLVQAFLGTGEGAGHPAAVGTAMGTLGAGEELVPRPVQRPTALDEQGSALRRTHEVPIGMSRHDRTELVPTHDIGEQGLGVACRLETAEPRTNDLGVGVVPGITGTIEGGLGQADTLGPHQVDVDVGSKLGLRGMVPGVPQIRPPLDMHGPRTSGVRVHPSRPDVQSHGFLLAHVGTQLASVRCGEYDGGSHLVVTLPKHVRGDLELLVDDGVGGQSTPLDHRLHVMDPDTSETPQWGLSGAIDGRVLGVGGGVSWRARGGGFRDHGTLLHRCVRG